MRQVRNGSMPVFFAVGLITLSAVASEITWHGGGGSLAWNDGTNWEGGEAPGEGDSATIPEGLEAVATTGTDCDVVLSVNGGRFGCAKNAETEAEISVIDGKACFRLAKYDLAILRCVVEK